MYLIVKIGMKVRKDERINNIKEYSEDKTTEKIDLFFSKLESKYYILYINMLYIISIVLIIISIFLILVFFNSVLARIGAIIILLLNIIIEIFKIIKINEEIRKIREMNKGKELDIKIREKEKEIKEKEIELKWLDIIKIIYERHNPYLEKFFKRLVEKGILSLRELEKEVIEQSEKVIFIIESGEGTSKIFRSVFKWKKKKEISEKSEDGEERSEIYFSEFMKKEFKKKIGDKIEIYRIPIPGISSFIVFCNENEQKCSDINNLYDIIYEGYSDYIDVEVRKDLNELKNEGKQKEYEELNKWYEEYKKALNDRSRPLILITMPYKISLFTLLKIISYYYKNKDHDIPKTIEHKINQILDQKIKLKNSGIRFLYLFDAVEFKEDEEIYKRFEELESRIVEKLKSKYKITEDNNYFYQLLHKENFIEKFEESLKEVDEDFYNKIKNDSRYKDLKRLIIDIQTKIFGVPVQNISI